MWLGWCCQGVLLSGESYFNLQDARGRKPIFTKKNVARMNTVRKRIVRKAADNREASLVYSQG